MLLGGKVVAVLRFAFRAELLEEHLCLSALQRATYALLKHDFSGPETFAACRIMTGIWKELLLASTLDHTHVLLRKPWHIVGC